MKKFLTAMVLSGCCWAAGAAETPFSEVVGVLKSRYVDRDRLDPSLLDTAALKGLLQELSGSVQILSADEAASNKTAVVATEAAKRLPLARAEIIDSCIGYIRLRDITEETIAALDVELKKCAEAKVTGFVLDLRFADGTNYEAAANVASRFVPAGQELFALKTVKGGRRVFQAGGSATVNSDAPVMVLVNARTRGGAEALAGALRANEHGVLVGARSAGFPVASEDVNLTDGRILRMATAKITLPSGADVFPGGIVPDVPVKIDPQIEREAVLNGATNVTLTTSLQPKQKKKNLSEAELVKAFRGEAMDLPTPGTVTKNDEEQDEVRDVVLQRAVDILKGIRVLQSWKND